MRGVINVNNSIAQRNFLGSTSSSFTTPIPVLNIQHSVLLHVNTNTPFTGFSSVSMQHSIMFHNNTFGSNFFWAVSSSYFVDNLFVGEATLPAGTNLHNIVQPVSFRPEVFMRYPASGSTLFLTESHDLHPMSSCIECIGKGIYSGTNSYRDVPVNPYITNRNISISPNGQSLQLNFTVNKGGN